MKSAPLLLEEIHVIGRDSISRETTDQELIDMISSSTKVHHTPGTAFIGSEKKFSTAGEYYANEINYSTPGWIAEDYNQKLSKAGAIIVTAKGGRKIVFHKNDLYQNTPLRVNINYSKTLSQIKLSINSITPL
jgi:hypothetical protein